MLAAYKFRKYVLVCLFLSISIFSSAQRQHIIFESNFDSVNSINIWYERAFLNPWSGSIVDSVSRAGKGSLRVELFRHLDTLNGPRAELGQAPQVQNEFWYGFSNFFPKDYVADPATEIINQWQALPDFNLGEDWRSPPLALEIKNDRFKVALRWSSAQVNDNSNTNVGYYDIGPVSHNRWNDWVFHVKWSHNSGLLEIWRNDTLVLQKLNQPIGYNDTSFPYFKVGIYKWEWNKHGSNSTSSHRKYYIDEVRIGNHLATYKDVNPKPIRLNSLPIKPNSLNVNKNPDGSYQVSFIASTSTSSDKTYILYVSDDNGKTFFPTFSDVKISMTKEKSYSVRFYKK